MMPRVRHETPRHDPGISPLMRNIILIYLAASIIAITVLQFGGDPFAGLLLVLFALPWSLLVHSITGLLGFTSAALNLALLAIGVGINAAALYLLARWLRTRQSTR